LEFEVSWGVGEFSAAGLERPIIFSSPGWTSPEKLSRVLRNMGFQQLYDLHLPGKSMRDASFVDVTGVENVNTGLAGEPGGIGYFECAYVRKWSSERCVAEIRRCLDQLEGRSVMVYDHPGFCVGVGRKLFEGVMLGLKKEGVRIVSPWEAS
jgi:hypothetical protein